MNSQGNSLYQPYGAFELKSRYQWNLLVSNLLLGGLIGLTLLTFVVFAPAQQAIPVLPDSTQDTTEVRAYWDVPPSVVYGDDRTPRPSTQDRTGWIPVPVADDTPFLDEATIMTREELSAVVGLPDSQPRTGGVYVNPDDTDYIPSPTEYVAADRLPEFIYMATPEYPRMINDAGITGRVIIHALVNKEGNVQDARVARSSGTKGLDEAALTAAYKNRFSPAIRAGQPIYIWVSYTVVFEQE